MDKPSMIKKVVATLTSSAQWLGSELPETPGLKLPQGKISTATRKQLHPLIAREEGENN
jgi:hypothetical protein